MSYLTGKDISHWNGIYTDTGEDFVMIKMSGGDAGLYLDDTANQHYNAAVAAGKVVGGYHFAGGTDPVAEANYFVDAMAPAAENDLYALDWEVNHTDPVGWCNSFVNEVHAKTGVWPFIYMDISRLQGYDWTLVLSNCGLWLAAPSYTFDQDAPVSQTYVMQQGAIVNGIDSDAFFGTREELQAYGYHAPQTIPGPVPAPPTPPPTPEPPVPTPEPTTPPSPTPPPAPAPDPTPVPTEPVQTPPDSTDTPNNPPPITVGSVPQVSFWQELINWLKSLIGVF